MSEEIKTTITEEENVRLLSEFANACYNKGAKDTLIGVGIGAAFSALIIFGLEIIDLKKDKKKSRKIELFDDETKKEIKEFVTYVNEEES